MVLGSFLVCVGGYNMHKYNKFVLIYHIENGKKKVGGFINDCKYEIIAIDDKLKNLIVTLKNGARFIDIITNNIEVYEELDEEDGGINVTITIDIDKVKECML